MHLKSILILAIVLGISGIAAGQGPIVPRPFPVEIITQPEQPLDEDAARREEQDLAAQTRMAQAAEDMIFWTKLQIVLGVFGTLGLVATLWTSLSANRITREVGINQTRAWISVKPGQLRTEPDGRLATTFTLTNRGSTPAMRVRYVGLIQSLPSPLTDPGEMVRPQENQVEPDHALSATETMEGTAHEFEGEQTLLAVLVRSQERAVCLVGLARYRDVFGHDRETKFCFVLAPDPTAAPMPDGMQLDWIATKFHNSAT